MSTTNSKTVTVALADRSYQIVIGHGVFSEIAAHLQRLRVSKQIVLVADSAIESSWGKECAGLLTSAGFDCLIISFQATEKEKTLPTVSTFYEKLIAHRCDRKSAVIALGGGIVGDTAGFAAATFMRGIVFVQCPTTLLSMVDASIGGKTGVNLPAGKNLVGSIHQPSVVVSDIRTLGTLPKREFHCGLAECVKHGLGDKYIFEFLERNVRPIIERDQDVLTELVAVNAQYKANIVSKDERESGLRAVLNLGHTFAHAIESTTGYDRIPHGEAVSLGVAAALTLSKASGKIDDSIRTRTIELLKAFSLPVSAELPMAKELIDAMAVDKKTERGILRIVLPENGHRISILDSPDEILLEDAWRSIGAK